VRSSLTRVLPLWGLISAAQITCTLKAHMKSAQVVRRLARHISNAERVLGGAAVRPVKPWQIALNGARTFASDKPYKGSSEPKYDFSRGAPGIPTWGWAAGALAAGGLYYAFTRQQKAEVENAPHNAGDRKSQKATADTPTVATKQQPNQAKLPSFQAFEVSTGRQ